MTAIRVGSFQDNVEKLFGPVVVTVEFVENYGSTIKYFVFSLCLLKDRVHIDALPKSEKKRNILTSHINTIRKKSPV